MVNAHKNNEKLEFILSAIEHDIVEEAELKGKAHLFWKELARWQYEGFKPEEIGLAGYSYRYYSTRFVRALQKYERRVN